MKKNKPFYKKYKLKTKKEVAYANAITLLFMPLLMYLMLKIDGVKMNKEFILWILVLLMMLIVLTTSFKIVRKE